MKQEEFDELFKVHQKIRPTTQVELVRLYLENISVDGKNALLLAFREAYPKLWDAIASVKRNVVGGRATVTAQRLFVTIYGRAPICPSCKESHFACLKQDRPIDLGRACGNYKCKCDFKNQNKILGNLQRFGVTNVFATQEFKENRVRFLQNKYGDSVTAPLLVPGAGDKVKVTSMARYGVSHFAKAESTKTAKAATCVERFGATCFLGTEEVKSMRRSTFLKKHGIAADHPTQIPSIEARRQQSLKSFMGDPKAVKASSEKRVKTCVSKYGVPHVSQDPTIHEKQQKFQNKLGVWRGEPIRYQGDELRVLKRLEAIPKVKEATTEKKHRIQYRFQGKDHWYFPDVEVLERDGTCWIVEVKSIWTLKCAFEKNLAKFRAAERYAANIGAEFVLAVTSAKGVAWARNPSQKLTTRLRQADVHL